MSNFLGPERGVFCILIIDIILKSALVGFSLLRASDYYYKKWKVTVDNFTIITIHRGLLIIVIAQSNFARMSYWYLFIIGYSTVKIERVSDRYWFYYNFRDIELRKLHLLVLHIKCVSVFWKHVVSDHEAATDFTRQSLGMFLCFSLFILILCLPIHEKHKHFLVSDHLVSDHGSATSLNR